MTLNLHRFKNINIPRLIFWLLFVLLIILITIACVQQYNDARAIEQRRAATIHQEQLKADATIAQRDAEKQASVTRLVSICMEARQQYDKLSAKDRTTRTRPNCDVAE